MEGIIDQCLMDAIALYNIRAVDRILSRESSTPDSDLVTLDNKVMTLDMIPTKDIGRERPIPTKVLGEIRERVGDGLTSLAALPMEMLDTLLNDIADKVKIENDHYKLIAKLYLYELRDTISLLLETNSVDEDDIADIEAKQKLCEGIANTIIHLDPMKYIETISEKYQINILQDYVDSII
jgi:hypothetical protein